MKGGRALGMKRALAAFVAVGFAVPALPQFTLLGGDENKPGIVLGGKPAIDLIPGVRRGLGYPLRNDNIVPGSVEVFVGGKRLAVEEYTVDCPSGVLYVSSQVSESDSIRVIYRHDDKAETKKYAAGALPLMSMNFGGGNSMTLLMGLGGAERQNGTVMQSNNLGFANKFGNGKASLNGFFARSSRENALVERDAATPDSGGVEQGEDVSGTFVKQAASFDVGGGMSLTAEYQDIDAKFTGFNMLMASGMSENQVKQFEKEKGITRMGLGFNGGSPNSILFSNSYRSIDDGKGKIQFQDYGFKTGFAEAYYSAREIDSGFTRFKDIAEEERDQYRKERGISREKMGGALSFAKTKLSFDQNTIGQDGAQIRQQTIGFESNFLGGALRTQQIDQGFSRTGDLAEKDREQWGRERGMSRDELSLFIPKGESRIASFDSKRIEYDKRSFESTSLSYNGGKYGIQYWDRSTDGNFLRLEDLSKSELASMAESTLRMYDPEVKVRDADRQWTAREAGIDRSFLKADASPFANLALSFSQIAIDADAGGLTRDSYRAKYGEFSFGYSRTSIESGFNRMFDLLEFERNLYGNQIGFDRAEWDLAGKVGSYGFKADGLSIDERTAGLDRMRAEVKGKGFELSAGSRNIDSEFARTFDVNDPERDLFTQLIGFRQQDFAIKFDAVKGLKINGFLFDAENGDAKQDRHRRELSTIFNPDSKTELEYAYRDNQFVGEKGALFQNNFQRIRGTRDLGKVGKVTLMREDETFGGEHATQPGRNTNYLKFETKLGKGFDFMTEQGRTTFHDGGYENYQGYKLGWQVTKRLGVNVEQVLVDRDGEKPDNEALNFGFNYDFGNNLKLGYTFREDIDTVVGGKSAYRWELTPGSVGGFNVGGSYASNSQTGREDSFLGNFSLSNPKPFDFGPLKDVKIQIGYDGKNEIGVWQNEKRLADFSTKLFGSEFGLNYSRVMLQGGAIASDRVARFNLDPTGKKPLQLSMAYKLRAMPDGTEYVVRDFDARYKINDVFAVSHSTDDLPEKEKNNAILGTELKPTLGRKWAIEYKPSGKVNAILGYEELSHLDQSTVARRTNLTLTFLEESGSPIKLSYTHEQNERPSDGRRTRNEYRIGFDQKPGDNQTLSIMLGYVDWRDGLPEGELWKRTLLSLDYQLRF